MITRPRRVPLVIAAVALVVGWTGVAATTAQAQTTTHTLTVRVGQDISPSQGRNADLMRYLPNELDVHQGDSLKFVGDFHTATALPAGTDVNGWVAANASRLGQPYFFLAPHGSSGVQFNPNVLYPAGCTPTSCAYDGSTLVNSGLLGVVTPSATMAVDVPAGTTFWVICLVHPHMRLQVRVVPDANPTPTQADLDAAAQQETATATAQAGSLWDALNVPHSDVQADGSRLWRAYAGYDSGDLELFAMFPQTLRIQRGDAVQWQFSQILYEPHSVVFPATTADAIASGPPPACDSDTGSGELPANQDFTCPAGSHGPVEIVVDPRVLQPAGPSAVTSATDYVNSGARGGHDVPSNAPFTLTFPVASPADGFAYACGVHGSMMTGHVIVS